MMVTSSATVLVTEVFTLEIMVSRLLVRLAGRADTSNVVHI